MFDNETKEIVADVASELIKSSIRSAWERVKVLFKDLNARELMEYGFAYEKYLDNTQSKYGRIKTLIYRRVPKDLYSFYECIGVLYNGKSVSTRSIRNLLKNESKIIITGTGGVGKSILCKHLFLNAIKETDLIPIFIELRCLNTIDDKEISLFDVIYQALTDNGFGLEKKYFEQSMKKGGYIVILDGFDEVNREKSNTVTKEILSLCSKYNLNKYIVSSRPTDEFIGWNDFSEMTTMPLSKRQALSLIGKIEFEGIIKEKFTRELGKNLYDKYSSFASNPLLLNIMLLTFDNHASIPDKLNDFYEQAFSALFSMHDATKDAYTRDIRTGLGCEDFKTIFSYICFKTYFRYEFEFTEAKLHKYIKEAKEKLCKNQFRIEDYQEDLLYSVCMLIKEGLNYSFSHRSFQEYFAAYYTCKLADEAQEKLLTVWLKESDSVNWDSYFAMLFDMQSERVNKNVLYPALKQLSLKYSELGFSIKLLSELFKGVNPRQEIDGEPGKSKFVLTLQINDQYLCYATILACRLNGYQYGTQDEGSHSVAKQLFDINTRGTVVTFDTATNTVGDENLIKSLGWFNKQLLFALSILERYSSSNLSRKKKVSSILDAL